MALDLSLSLVAGYEVHVDVAAEYEAVVANERELLAGEVEVEQRFIEGVEVCLSDQGKGAFVRDAGNACGLPDPIFEVEGCRDFREASKGWQWAGGEIFEGAAGGDVSGVHHELDLGLSVVA